jgi:hypothetical protein
MRREEHCALADADPGSLLHGCLHLFHFIYLQADLPAPALAPARNFLHS